MKAILRALWGRRLVVLISVLFCLAGGLTVIATSPPRYEGRARVVLDYIKPDPITGAVVPSKMLEAYISSQISLIRDFQVTGPAVESLGFLENPDVQQAYYLNPPSDGRDLHTWIAAQVAAAAGGVMVADTNILEIRYVASSPELAESVVDALRAAFVESSARGTRAMAQQKAESLASRIQTAKVTLAQLEALKNRFEDEAGITINERGRDEELAKLENIIGRLPSPIIVQDAGPSPAGAALERLDAQIALASSTLGPNNPNLIAMRQQRGVLEVQARLEAEAARAKIDIGAANERAVAAFVEQQKERVLAVREPTLRLRLMQDEINRQRDELIKLMEDLVTVRTLAGVSTSTTTPIGPAVGRRAQVFPNVPLIVLGSGGIGLVGGALLALLVELLARHVRSAADLGAVTGARVLGEIPNVRRTGRSRRVFGRRSITRGEAIGPHPVAAE
jgi:uncharacterized protein involved in exopolysaccharide biosynthesis